MKTKLEQVLDRCLDGREVAIWGTPTRLLLRMLQKYPCHIADCIDMKRHYVVVVTEQDAVDFQLDQQSSTFKYADDFLVFEDTGAELPFEWECHNVPIGRQSYFSEHFVNACKYGFIESIGHFTSINNTAMVHSDHQQNMMFVSDDLPDLFSEENRAIYKARHDADPKHPGGSGKKRITIGNDVWIGGYSFINASKVSSIGDGAMIGAGAVVLEDVPPYAVVVGAPARIMRYRFSPEVISALLELKWWEWSVDELDANAEALILPERFMKRYMRE